MAGLGIGVIDIVVVIAVLGRLLRLLRLVGAVGLVQIGQSLDPRSKWASVCLDVWRQLLVLV